MKGKFISEIYKENYYEKNNENKENEINVELNPNFYSNELKLDNVQSRLLKEYENVKTIQTNVSQIIKNGIKISKCKLATNDIDNKINLSIKKLYVQTESNNMDTSVTENKTKINNRSLEKRNQVDSKFFNIFRINMY